MDFKSQLESLKSYWGLVIAAVAAGPLALWSKELQPPWPSSSAVVATTACLVGVWIILGLTLVLRGSQMVRWIGLVALLLSLSFGGAYIRYFSRYVIWIEVSTATSIRDLPVVVGDELKPGVVQAGKTSRELLLDASTYADDVWTEESIRDAQMKLLVTFVGCFFFLTLGTTALSLSQNTGVA